MNCSLSKTRTVPTTELPRAILLPGTGNYDKINSVPVPRNIVFLQLFPSNTRVRSAIVPTCLCTLTHGNLQSPYALSPDLRTKPSWLSAMRCAHISRRFLEALSIHTSPLDTTERSAIMAWPGISWMTLSSMERRIEYGTFRSEAFPRRRMSKNTRARWRDSGEDE